MKKLRRRDGSLVVLGHNEKSVNLKNPLVARKLAKEAQQLAKQLRKKLNIEVLNAPEYDATAPCISTGFQAIDDVITGKLDESGHFAKGAGHGFPRGRMIEIYGPEASAKTSLVLSVIAQAQKMGLTSALIDAEHALDSQYARRSFDIDMDALLWTQPETGEEAIETLLWCVDHNIGVVALDSVAALSSTAELEGRNALGEQARMMSRACRKIGMKLKPGGPLVIFINQIRYKIGVVFGNPEITSGGNALKYYASVRAEVRKRKDLSKAGNVKREPIITGHRIGMRIIKNKVAPCGGRVTFDVLFGKGIRIPKARDIKPMKGLEEGADE